MTTSGILVLDKPSGMTSHDVVARVRLVFNTRKVGHAGTLDPMATGVLIIGINDATRMLGHLMLSTKRYQATIRLGASTSTDDSEGELSVVTDTGFLSESLIVRSLGGQVGMIEQVPSSVSAVRVNGRRAHEIVRSGKPVDLAARTVEVHSIEIGRIQREAPYTDIEIVVDCSAGTFVRAIARDLGVELGVGAHLVALRRISSGPFDLENSVTLSELDRSETPCDQVCTMGQVAELVWPCVTVNNELREKISMGQRIPSMELPERDILALLDADGELLALVSNGPQGMKYRAVFIGVS